MNLRNQVVERLLVSKSLLARVRFQPLAEPDRLSLASQILTAHDAAELALAAIADHLGKLPTKDKHYLMDYFDPIKSVHPERDVFAKEYFSQLNRVRVDIKHYGLFPDAKQWARVAETVYGHVSKWCSEYLGVTLEMLNESALLTNDLVKKRFLAAQETLNMKCYKEALELVGVALYEVFESNAALRGLAVGRPRPEDAIKLAAFGVHANDFLALQEFLPEVRGTRENDLEIKWTQEQYGHPGNWREETTRFCLNAFLDVALRIQNAQWIPGPAHFHALYEFKVTAARDGVEVWNEVVEGDSPAERLFGLRKKKVVVKVLNKGEVLRGHISPVRSSNDPLRGLLGPRGPIEAVFVATTVPEEFLGYVAISDVKITCVPRDSEVVKKYFSELTEIDWQPE
ncbi:MAG: hypothetical protein M1453_12170 [Acidobacteria bacterium]|nr:hypothetical protein [Acidobacteriota bacterium]MCL5288734.1 hypothetical protein [Acidobacteriota bacterium]